jgi:hypothetical protein
MHKWNSLKAVLKEMGNGRNDTYLLSAKDVTLHVQIENLNQLNPKDLLP